VTDVRLLLLNIALLLGFSAIVIAQSPPPEPPIPVNPTVPERPLEPNRRRLKPRYVWVFEYRFTSEEKKLLEPSPSDHDKFASFLRSPDAGLVRLYPWMRWRRVISVDDLGDRRSPEFSAHASIYSFSKNRHGSALNGFVDPRLGWAELKLGEGRFFSGFTGESLGVLVSLGNTPIETVTPETNGVTGLTNITPPADYLEASSLSRRNRAGFELDRFSYGSSLPVTANTTYVLRSTSNKRSDILVAFRVVEVGSDGDVTILWRKLKSYPKPEWKRRD
jgi:hypothetical protein